MPSQTLQPQEPVVFGGRPQGYVIHIRKQQFNHPVRYIAKDTNDNIIAAGTVPQNRTADEFLVHPNVGFTLINVGTWSLIVDWV